MQKLDLKAPLAIATVKPLTPTEGLREYMTYYYHSLTVRQFQVLPENWKGEGRNLRYSVSLTYSSGNKLFSSSISR